MKKLMFLISFINFSIFAHAEYLTCSTKSDWPPNGPKKVYACDDNPQNSEQTEALKVCAIQRCANDLKFSERLAKGCNNNVSCAKTDFTPKKTCCTYARDLYEGICERENTLSKASDKVIETCFHYSSFHDQCRENIRCDSWL